MKQFNLCILLSISSSTSITIVSANNKDEDTIIQSTQHLLLRGRSLQKESSSPVVRPNIFSSTNDNDENNSTTSSSLPLLEHYTEDPFTSNVHDFINTTHTISQPLTSLSPSISPPPTLSPSPTDTTIMIKPPPPSTIQTPTTPYQDTTTLDDKEFKEFIAFVGWYAFLILCCILPTICTYYKRRRNAYLLNENISSIRMRLEEMELYNSRHNGGGAAVGFGGNNEGATSFGAGSVLRLGENNQDWEVLESLFGNQNPNNITTQNSTGTTTNFDRASAAVTIATLGLMEGSSANDADRRRQIMSDILMGGMSVRNVMEREQRRKRERGRRLVSLLKECSLWVKESHLILKEGGSGGGNEYGVNYQDGGEGDVELGTVFSTVQNDVNDDHDNDVGKKGEKKDYNDGALKSNNADATVNEGSQIRGKSDVDLESTLRMNDGDEEECCQQTTADETNNEAAAAASTTTTTSTTAAASNAAESTTHQAAIATANTQSSSSSLPSTTADNSATMSNNNILSLYQTDDLYLDDDDDDNKYTALCLPCSPTHRDAMTTTTTTFPVTRSAPPQSITDNDSSSTRLVPPTCAICLSSYSPGCYVTWSSNPECTHVFHRDCILVWLLKKEEPLCPCCRREFVSTSSLNAEPTDAENDEGDHRLEEYRRSIMLLERSQSMAAMRRASNNSNSRRASETRRFARMSLQEHTTPPNWDSVGLGRVRHF